jgi:ATP-dependent Clp protease ATP-binding subunit ClpA
MNLMESGAAAFRSNRDFTESLELLADLLPVRDLTGRPGRGSADGLNPSFPSAVSGDPAVQAALARSLCSEVRRHVLLTGLRGVGKTTMVLELARRATAGEHSRLSGSRFIWIDAQNVGPEDSRACLESIIGVFRTLDAPVVLCIDGLAALLKRTQGGSNKPLLRAFIARPNLRLIGVLSTWEYLDLIGGDSDMQDLFNRIEVPEPTEKQTVEIARAHAAALESRYSITIPAHVIERSVDLTSTFILNEARPAKVIQILRQAAEDVDYERTAMDGNRSGITVDDIVRTVSRKTGIPEQTIAGHDGEVDFEAALGDAVVGQEAAVAQVANELRLIKAGLTEPGKPAAVMLFAGMTGVGKTELAKRIAELYSTSHRVQVYAMGNYTEPHSVSGIIGVPPGYVGFEEGGRLINELNSDPYSVFLLDEAEKCHPNIWKPFLNLFDEGWIADQRGIKAYGDRAIFILTTNAGDQSIAQMTENGSSSEEIVQHVKEGLSRVRHERSSQAVFPPQFLSRIKRIVVFGPLPEDAMIGITFRACQRMQRLWLQKREKRIEISREVIEAIGREAHRRNQKAHGEEGGRIVKKLVSDLIETRIQEASIADRAAYLAALSIRVELGRSPNDIEWIKPPDIEVTFSDGLSVQTAANAQANT